MNQTEHIRWIRAEWERTRDCKNRNGPKFDNGVGSHPGNCECLMRVGIAIRGSVLDWRRRKGETNAIDS